MAGPRGSAKGASDVKRGMTNIEPGVTHEATIIALPFSAARRASKNMWPDLRYNLRRQLPIAVLL